MHEKPPPQATTLLPSLMTYTRATCATNSYKKTLHLHVKHFAATHTLNAHHVRIHTHSAYMKVDK
eukprot:c35460_g1_i1 orf=34-228(-)